MTPRRLVIPLYLFLCLIVGGSVQSEWAMLALQLLGVAIIAWVLVDRRPGDWTPAARQFLILTLATAALVALQLIPLPAGLWSSLPGRGPIAQGYEILGYSLPSLPVSLTPYSTLPTVLAALPFLAVFAGSMHVWQRQGLVAAALLSAACAAVMLGALQVTGGGPESSPWYLYDITNHGAVGFFANSNHMGSLLLVCIPFAIAVLASAGSHGKRPGSTAGMMTLGVAGLVVVTAGLMLNRSLAALGIAMPVILFSALLLPGGWKWRKLALPAGALALAASLFFVMRTPITATAEGTELQSLQSRTDMWSATIELIQQYFPVGSGFGSFAHAFRFAEDPATVGSKFANHAHNEYLELLLELGLAGAILMLLFLAWWLLQTARVWRSNIASYYSKAATIASGALLAHSLVDYPLRTPALAAVFAICLGMMARPRPPQEAEAGEARTAKHMAI